MDRLVEAFFRSYETATSNSDFAIVGDLYAETFLFAGPCSVHSVRREDFLKIIPKMKTQFYSAGLRASRFSSVEAEDLDSRYVLAKVRWEMTIQLPGGDLKGFDAFATYVLDRCDDKLTIIFQLDHQDLAAVVKEQRNA